MPKLTTTEMQAWRGFLHAHAAIFKALGDELATKFDLSMPAYELLLTLEEGSTEGYRMSELARRLRFSGGGLTRLVDRLQAAGYVDRKRCEADGRGFEVTLSPEGKRRLRRVHAQHVKDVRSLYLNHLTIEEQDALASIWDRLLSPAMDELTS